MSKSEETAATTKKNATPAAEKVPMTERKWFKVTLRVAEVTASIAVGAVGMFAYGKFSGE